MKKLPKPKMEEMMEAFSKIGNRTHRLRKIIKEGARSYIPDPGKDVKEHVVEKKCRPRPWPDPSVQEETPEERIKALEECISDLLDFLDSEELKGEAMMAWIHGYRVPKEVSKRNGQMIEDAYKLIGKEKKEK